MILPELLPVLAIHLYALGTAAVVAGILARNEWLKRAALVLTVLAFTTHTLLLIATFMDDGFTGLTRSVYVQLLAWCITLSGLVAWLRWRYEALLLTVAPFSLLTFLIALLLRHAETPLPPVLSGMTFTIHIAAIFISIGLMALAFGAGVLFLIQAKSIKSKSKLAGFQKDLPALSALDKINAFTTTVGFPLFTAGVLDTFMENDVYFPAVAGVSAGSLNAVNYASHQPGRSASINLRYRHDSRYFGPKAALRGGSLFGLKFMLNDVKKEVPFDEETFAHGGMRVIAVATNVETGKPAYFEKGKTDFPFDEAVRASASLPLASVPVVLDGQPYLDGGCSCPIALNWALNEGFEKIVVITTRQKGFRKAMPGQRMVDLYDDFYGDKPLFLADMLTQELRYNTLMDQLDELEADGRICCVRPQEPITIGRFEGDENKLLDLYNRGHREGREALDAVCAYLEK